MNEWAQLTLAEVCEKITDGSHQSPQSTYEGKPMASVKDLTPYGITVETCRLISDDDFLELKRQGCSPKMGDVLIAKDGNSALDTVCVFDSEEDVVLLSSVAILRPKDTTDPYFLRYYLDTPSVRDLLKGGYLSGSAIPRVILRDFKLAPILIPEKKEQIAIGRVLKKFDDKIELNQKMNQTLEDIAKAIFKSWFVDFDPVRAKAESRPTGLPPEISDLFPDELVDSEIGDIPKGWSPSVAGDLFDCLDRKRIPLSGNDRAKRKGSIPYYGATGVIDHVDDHIFDGTYLLLGEDGSVEKEDGTAFSQYVSGKIWVNNHAHVLIGKGSISTEFLYLAFQFLKVSPFVTGAVQLKISQTNLRSIPITSPSPEISEQFQEIVAPMFERRLLLEKENLCLAQLRDTLLPKLISGELSIPDANKFLEEAGI